MKSNAPRATLEPAIAKAGTVGALAALMARDRRTVSRWRSGASPIPQAALRWLTQYLQENGK